MALYEFSNSPGSVMYSSSGAWYVGRAGAEPTKMDGAGVPAGFTSLGYLSEDGTEMNIESESKDIKAFQRNQVIKSLPGDQSATFTFNMLETHSNSLYLYANNAGDGGRVTSVDGKVFSFIFDVVEEDGDYFNFIRIAIPYGKVTERKPVTFKHGEPIVWGITIKALNTGGYLYRIGHRRYKAAA